MIKHIQETWKPPILKELRSDIRDKNKNTTPIAAVVIIAMEEIETKHMNPWNGRELLENLMKGTITWSGPWMMGRILTGISEFGEEF